MRITMVPLNALLSSGVSFCTAHKHEQCETGRFGLGCEHFHRIRGSVRVRCQHDGLGWECPTILVCSLDHQHPVNTERLPWVYKVVEDRSNAWMGGVGIGGRGLQNRQFWGCAVCGSNDSAWDVPGPAVRTGPRASRFRGYGSRSGNSGRNLGRSAHFGAVATTPGNIKPGDHNGHRHGSRFRQLWPL